MIETFSVPLVLDWYHLIENLHRVGGSLKRLRRAQSQLWQGSTVEAIAEFVGVRSKQSEKFQKYLRKHQSRIPDYQNYQQQGIDIGSGAVESLIKQIPHPIMTIPQTGYRFTLRLAIYPCH